jgi:hypothetical protein
MTMRARAAVLVFALMLSPLSAAVCELRCAPPASPRLNAHLSCHDAGTQARERLQSPPRHCSDRHHDGAVAGVQTAGASTRDMQAVYTVITVADHPPASAVLLFRRSPREKYAVRTATSSPPLRI